MKKFSLKDTLKQISECESILKESCIYNECGDEEMQQEMGVEEPYGEGIDEAPCKDNDCVNAIRKAALEGIQKYADDVDSEQYQFFKKVWMMADKCLSEKDSVEEEN